MTGPVNDVARLERNYRTTFLRYLLRREEEPLHLGYVLGRSAVADGLSLLDLSEVHHTVLTEVLQSAREADLGDIAAGASEFFVEVLAAYDMTQRASRPPPS